MCWLGELRLRRKAWPFPYHSFGETCGQRNLGFETYAHNDEESTVTFFSSTGCCVFCPTHGPLASKNLARRLLVGSVYEKSFVRTLEAIEEVDLVANIAASVNICSNKSSETVS